MIQMTTLLPAVSLVEKKKLLKAHTLNLLLSPRLQFRVLRLESPDGSLIRGLLEKQSDGGLSP